MPLQTTNHRVRPEVELGFFIDPEDVVSLRRGGHLAMRLDERPPQTGVHIEESTRTRGAGWREVRDIMIKRSF